MKNYSLTEDEMKELEYVPGKFGDDEGTEEVRVFLTGYDTSLPMETVAMALIKHVSSCGRLSDIMVSPDLTNGGLYDVGFVSIRGEGTLEKVEKLKLNGGCESDVEGGCKLVVYKILPLSFSGFGYSAPLDLLNQAKEIARAWFEAEAKAEDALIYFAAHRNHNLAASLRLFCNELKAKEPQSDRKRNKISAKKDDKANSSNVVRIND